MNRVKRIIIDNSQGALPYVHDHIKDLRKANRKLTFGMIMFGVALVALNKVIEELREEVQELKQARGE